MTENISNPNSNKNPNKNHPKCESQINLNSTKNKTQRKKKKIRCAHARKIGRGEKKTVLRREEHVSASVVEYEPLLIEELAIEYGLTAPFHTGRRPHRHTFPGRPAAGSLTRHGSFHLGASSRGRLHGRFAPAAVPAELAGEPPVPGVAAAVARSSGGNRARRG